MEVGEFVFGIMMLVVAVLSAFALVRELKRRNFFAVLFAGASLALFGWYSVMTIFSQLFLA
ncbi:membrane associated rhomboid family serine protease [Alkalibacillus flavidus]|uniref:Membrane associated rhomboid family serine protease n=1 Tax=Alkalibacillus flavidus TaxID=546021 RepID=A0ABV2KXF7_9BACI